MHGVPDPSYSLFLSLAGSTVGKLGFFFGSDCESTAGVHSMIVVLLLILLLFLMFVGVLFYTTVYLVSYLVLQ